MKALILIAALITASQVSLSQPHQLSTPQRIKVLSWNIYMLPGFLANRNSKRAERIGELLAGSDYDVIVFQEAFCPFARHKIKQKLLQFSYRAGPANRKWFSMKTNSGVWIVSRYPIVSSQSIIFKNRHGSDALSRKGALMIDLLIQGKRIQVIGTHLQNSGAAWLGHAQCVELYERLLKPYQIEGVPQIVCGDFNINKSSAVDSYRFMLTSLEAEDGKLVGKNQFTYDRLHNDLRVEKGNDQDIIDYILVRTNGGWVDCPNRSIRIMKKKWNNHHQDLSDHYSMEAEIYFTNFPSMVTLLR